MQTWTANERLLTSGNCRWVLESFCLHCFHAGAFCDAFYTSSLLIDGTFHFGTALGLNYIYIYAFYPFSDVSFHRSKSFGSSGGQ